MSPGLHNFYTDGVVREIKRRVVRSGAVLKTSKVGCSWDGSEQVAACNDTTLVVDSTLKVNM